MTLVIASPLIKWGLMNLTGLNKQFMEGVPIYGGSPIFRILQTSIDRWIFH